MYTCAWCNQNAEAMLQCAVCKVARYCTKACQKSDWKNGHKAKCRQFMPISQNNTHSVYVNQAVPPRNDKQASWLYDKQSQHTAMFMVASKQVVAKPFARTVDPNRTVLQYLQDEDWYGWYNKETKHFEEIIKGRMAERDSCKRRKDWRGWLGAAVAEQAMANCEAWCQNILSAHSRCQKAKKYITLVLESDSYKNKTIPEADRADVDGAYHGIMSMSKNFDALLIQGENQAKRNSFFQMPFSYGHAAAIERVILFKPLIASYENERYLWETAENFINVYCCHVSILQIYNHLAIYALDDGDSPDQVFDVSLEVFTHVTKAAEVVKEHNLKSVGVNIDILLAPLYSVLYDRMSTNTPMHKLPSP